MNNGLYKVMELFKKDPEIQKVSEKHLKSGNFPLLSRFSDVFWNYP